MAARGRAPGPQPLRFVPPLTLILFLGPVAAGLIATIVPSFGLLPALGGEHLTLAAWRELLAFPGIGRSVRLTLVSGLTATAISFAIVVGFCAACHGTRAFTLMRRMLSPLLSVPHAAVALGLLFLLSPSGWAIRLVSPWATGWDLPPDLPLAPDPWGLVLIAGLVVKEVPFLFLMTVAALGQVPADRTLAIARSLGYGRMLAWIKTVLPLVYPQIRLPLFAVLAFSLSVVDVALILAPATPPPLAVRVLGWFRDPDLSRHFLASAGACLQLGIAGGAIGLWLVLERLAAALGRRWISAGGRGTGAVSAGPFFTALVAGLISLGTAAIAGMALWSFARRWRYPDALPSQWTMNNWYRQADALAWPAWTTVVVGVAAALIALGLVLGCLEAEKRYGIKPSNRGLWLLYTPLLVPQVGFLLGVKVLLVLGGLDGGWVALIWTHLLFVLPYIFLSLSDPFRKLDDRYARTALCLGASPARVFWRVRAPMLLRPILIAAAVGFAVSVGQYLPTIFGGGGRFVTLTTEAVSLAGGADRRVIGVYALLQAVLPLIAFVLAMAVPNWIYRERGALRHAT